MTADVALLLTVAVEAPLWVAGLRATGSSGPVRAVAAAVGVNVLTHPLLWAVLAPAPTLTSVLAAEGCVVVVEAAVVRLVIGRRAGVALLLALGANAASLACGLLLMLG